MSDVVLAEIDLGPITARAVRARVRDDIRAALVAGGRTVGDEIIEIRWGPGTRKGSARCFAIPGSRTRSIRQAPERHPTCSSVGRLTGGVYRAPERLAAGHVAFGILLSVLSLAAETQVGSPLWLVVGWVFVGIGVVSFLVILADILRGYRQHMSVMNWVWPITGLYWGPVAVYFYLRRGRRMSPRWAQEHRMDMDQMMSAGDEEEPLSYWPFARKNWWPISKGVSHCGAGCTLGDICGEWIVYLSGWSIAIFAAEAPNTLMAMYVADFVLAWTFGIIFQYFSIVPMREDVGKLAGIWAAIKADTLSIVSFQIGLFGFMALFHLVFFKPPLSVASPTYWFMMQIGMIVGFFTAWPVNTWLIRKGWKEKM